MVKTIEDFRLALDKVLAIRDETWNKENFQVELTRALTTLENARMEWNSARIKLPVLAGETKAQAVPEKGSPFANAAAGPSLANLSFWQLCKIGLALTWPLLVVIALGALGILAAIQAHK